MSSEMYHEVYYANLNLTSIKILEFTALPFILRGIHSSGKSCTTLNASSSKPNPNPTSTLSSTILPSWFTVAETSAVAT